MTVRRYLLHREKSFTALKATLNSPQLPKLVDGVEKVLAAELRDGETLPDVGLLVELVMRVLTGRLDRLVKAEWRLDGERRARIGLRRQLRAAVKALRDKLVILRLTLEGSYGKTATIQLTGLKGELSRDGTTLFQQADAALDRLSRPNLKLPPLKLRGVRHDPEKWLKHFRDEATALDEALSQVGTNTRKVEHFLVLKDEALTEYNDLFFKFALLLEALFLLAGHETFARAIRPSRQKKGLLLAEMKKPRANREAEASDTEGSEDHHPENED